MAKEHNVDEESMRRLVKKDLQFVPCKLAEEHHLTDQMKASMLEKCKKMKSLGRGDALNRILFIGENTFMVQPFRNSQNQRELLNKVCPCIVKVEKVLFPKSVIVWAQISELGKTKLVLVPNGAKINAEMYQELILVAAVIP